MNCTSNYSYYACSMALLDSEVMYIIIGRVKFGATFYNCFINYNISCLFRLIFERKNYRQQNRPTPTGLRSFLDLIDIKYYVYNSRDFAKTRILRARVFRQILWRH